MASIYVSLFFTIMDLYHDVLSINVRRQVKLFQYFLSVCEEKTQKTLLRENEEREREREKSGHERERKLTSQTRTQTARAFCPS